MLSVSPFVVMLKQKDWMTMWPSDRVTEWPSDWVTEWPSDWVIEWQEASHTIDRMVYLEWKTNLWQLAFYYRTRKNYQSKEMAALSKDNKHALTWRTWRWRWRRAGRWWRPSIRAGRRTHPPSSWVRWARWSGPGTPCSWWSPPRSRPPNISSWCCLQTTHIRRGGQRPTALKLKIIIFLFNSNGSTANNIFFNQKKSKRNWKANNF